MADPTVEQIVRRGLRRAGEARPSPELVARARDEWIQELLSDIGARAIDAGSASVLSSLEITQTTVAEVGRRRYPLPDDFDDDSSVTLLDGALRGTIVTAEEDQVTTTLAGLTSDTGAGHYLVVLDGIAKGAMREIVSVDTGVSPTLLTLDRLFDEGETPAPGDTFLVVDEVIELQEWNTEDGDRWEEFGTGQPAEYRMWQGNVEFNIAPDKVYAIRVRYIPSLSKVDVTSETMAALLLRWQHVLVIGVWKLAAEENDDDQSRLALAQYEAAVSRAIAKEVDYMRDFEGFTL